MRAIHMITKMIDSGIIKDPNIKRMNIHLIQNEETFKNLNQSSALNTDWNFLQMLKEEGRKTADFWLQINKQKLCEKQTSIDETIFDYFV